MQIFFLQKRVFGKRYRFFCESCEGLCFYIIVSIIIHEQVKTDLTNIFVSFPYSLPPGVGEIHAKICTTPKRKRDSVSSRNSLCLDMTLNDDDSDVEEKQAPRSKIRCKRSGSFSLHAKDVRKPNNTTGVRKTSGSYVSSSSSTLTKASKDRDGFQIEMSDTVFEVAPSPKAVNSSKIIDVDKNNGPKICPVQQIEKLFQQPDVVEIDSDERRKNILHSTSNTSAIFKNLQSKLSDEVDVDPGPSSTVECPLCFEPISIDRIETHAANCNGEKTTTTEVAKQPEMEECPICNEQISVYKIGIHASLCANTKYKNDSTLERISATKGEFTVGTSKNESVHVAKDLSQCPICLVEFNKSYIDFHVNICLDSSSA